MTNPYKKLRYVEEKEIVPRKCCTDDLLKRLRKQGINTNGYEHGLEDILLSKGFGLPVADGEHFMFSINPYIRYYLNYADSLSEEILLLRELKMF